MIGSTLSHYRILEPLGQGGMGVVWRARDERLERDVALKVLPAAASSDETSRKRFGREALALSRLNHPHIGTIYDFDSQAGTEFLVMEVIAGETLERRLSAGALTEKDAVALASQIAEALEAAHEQGVVHRDLKPGNVMVTARGQVKVLDFGLARMLETPSGPPPTERLTTTEALAGTIPYMAPEQLLGQDADARSDLYALGVVLFEMATGRLPYRQKIPTALAGEILHQPPLRASDVCAVSPALEALIARCLEKEPARRFASARELVGALQAVSAGAAPAPARPSIQSLAVLPLENLSGDPEQDYFADGLTEELISTLGQIGALRVISRTSAMQYKGVRRPLPEIARALNVDAVVEGSVRRAGNRVRIMAQLIEAATDRHLWAKAYQGDLSDVLALQGEVAQAIAQEVRIKLTPEEEKRLAGPRPVAPDAYEAYLRGRFHWNKRTEESMHKGIEYFRRAIEIDPLYALAHVGLADSYNILGFYAYLAPRDAFPKARAAAARALEIDPNLAEAHCSLAYVRHYHDWDWASAEAGFRRALEIAPGYATAHQFYGNQLVALRRYDQAVAEMRRALELDPLSLIMTSAIGFVLYLARRHEDAAEWCRKAIEMDPSFMLSHLWLSFPLEQQGRIEEAIAAIDRAVSLSGGHPGLRASQARIWAIAGRADEARKILAELSELSRQRYVSAYRIAGIHTGLGEVDRAFDWLERAYEERSNQLVFLNVDAWLDPLRSDPRFESLVKRVGLP